MKVLRPLTLVLVGFLTACGGGGGGGDDVDACEQYCAFFCSKASNCGFFPAEDRLTCESSCISEADRIGRTEDSCRNSQRDVESATCDELSTLLGLQRESPHQDMTAEDLGIVFGEDFVK